MRYIVDILPAALSDIIEAAQWYEKQRSSFIWKGENTNQ
jgi:hypothetical protein